MTPQGLAAIHAAANHRERPWSVQEFADLLKQPGVFCTANPYSFVLGRLILDEAEVLTLATHPDHQRQGHARAALTTFEEHARLRGGKTVLLEVAEDNEAAKALYLSRGYVQAGQRYGYYTMADGSRVTALVMRKALGTP